MLFVTGCCTSGIAGLLKRLVDKHSVQLTSKLTASGRIAVEHKRIAGFQIKARVGQERVAVVLRVRPARVAVSVESAG
jgi:hypothetical protein